jgi:hypothetical protein
MINNPENGHNPEVRDTEADPPQDARTAAAVAEPGAQAVTPVREPAPAAQAAGDESAASAELPATTDASESELSSAIIDFRQKFDAIQAEFISEPRAAVEKAETLIDGLMTALHNKLQRVHTNVESATDTEHLRVAMLGYRELFDSLGSHRAP